MKKENTELRNKYGAFAGTFGIISNLILGLIKLIIGFISNSVSIIADAFNSLSDSFTSILTIIGFKLSCKKASKVHPYGYARYEYVSGFVISLFMLLMGILFVTKVVMAVMMGCGNLWDSIGTMEMLVVILPRKKSSADLKKAMGCKSPILLCYTLNV